MSSTSVKSELKTRFGPTLTAQQKAAHVAAKLNASNPDNAMSVDEEYNNNSKPSGSVAAGSATVPPSYASYQATLGKPNGVSTAGHIPPAAMAAIANINNKMDAKYVAVKKQDPYLVHGGNGVGQPSHAAAPVYNNNSHAAAMKGLKADSGKYAGKASFNEPRKPQPKNKKTNINVTVSQSSDDEAEQDKKPNLSDKTIQDLASIMMNMGIGQDILESGNFKMVCNTDYGYCVPRMKKIIERNGILMRRYGDVNAPAPIAISNIKWIDTGLKAAVKYEEKMNKIQGILDDLPTEVFFYHADPTIIQFGGRMVHTASVDLEAAKLMFVTRHGVDLFTKLINKPELKSATKYIWKSRLMPNGAEMTFVSVYLFYALQMAVYDQTDISGSIGTKLNDKNEAPRETMMCAALTLTNYIMGVQSALMDLEDQAKDLIIQRQQAEIARLNQAIGSTSSSSSSSSSSS